MIMQKCESALFCSIRQLNKDYPTGTGQLRIRIER